MYGLACTICIQSAICRPQQHTVWSQNIARKTLVMMHIQPFDFFNGNNDFSSITDQKDWGISYIGPYDPASTYHAQLQAAGIETVMPDSYHYGRDGHSWWFKYILNYLISNKFI